MEFQFYYTISILILMSSALAVGISRPWFIVFNSLIFLIVGNVISINEAFVGFSNRGMLTVAILFVISASVRASGLLEKIIYSVHGKNSSNVRIKIFKLMFSVASISAFLNNTPIFASLIPIIKNRARKNNYPVSKFLIPLSCAAIFGMVTLTFADSTCFASPIGYQTNLMGMDPGGYRFLDFFKIGLIMNFFIGLIVVVLVKVFILSKGKG